MPTQWYKIFNRYWVFLTTTRNCKTVSFKKSNLTNVTQNHSVRKYKIVNNGKTKMSIAE